MSDHIESCSGAEIDDDQITAVAIKGTCGIYQPVGADDCALIDAWVIWQITIRFSNHIGPGVEIAVAQHAQIQAPRAGTVEEMMTSSISTSILLASNSVDSQTKY